MRKVLILDTSILCVWLEVPGMGHCGPNDDRWDGTRVTNKIRAEEKDGTTFVLPLASIIETGNHIAHAPHNRRKVDVPDQNPLKADSLCSTCDNRCEESETPYLLDPTDPGDVGLIAFDEEGGVIPSPGISDWEVRWVEETIKRLKLNEHEPLTEERKKSGKPFPGRSSNT